MEKVDTTKLKESAKDIIELTRGLNEEITSLYSRITNMPTRTFEWIGPSATDYVRRANLEKIQYNKFIATLNKYGNELASIANDYDKIISNLR